MFFCHPVMCLKRNLGLSLICVFVSISTISGQNPAIPPTSVPSQPHSSKKVANSNSLEKNFFKNLLKDQEKIWTSPFRLGKKDVKWLVPLAAGTGTLFATDRQTASALNNNQDRIDLSLDLSKFGSAYAGGGTALTFYAVGKITDNRRAQETGLLAAEALINSAIVVQAIKFVTQRPRPLFKNDHGTFFTGGNSFPSGHAATAWTVAAVIDGEYGKRHRLVRYSAYGLATAVSLSRYSARRHFLSDVLIGSAIGFGIGRFTVARHHDSSLDFTMKKTTKLEKYFPVIAPQYDPRNRTYGARLSWNL